MFRLGDSRSIRYSEIPDEILVPFKHPGQSLDSARRDLIAACFLERKPPDLLFFGHKSFAEYLVAEKIFSLMNEMPPTTDELNIKLSLEILSFVMEMTTEQQWHSVVINPQSNSRLIDESLKTLLRSSNDALVLNNSQFERAIRTSSVINAWQPIISVLPKMMVFRLVEYIERELERKHLDPKPYETFLKDLIHYDEDLVSVHAYRALAKGGIISVDELRSAIGKKKYSTWLKMKWIPSDAEIAAQEVIGTLGPKARSRIRIIRAEDGGRNSNSFVELSISYGDEDIVDYMVEHIVVSGAGPLSEPDVRNIFKERLTATIQEYLNKKKRRKQNW